MLVDMPLDELKQYKPNQYKKDDFDNFWDDALSVSARQPLNEEIIKIDYIVNKIKVNKIYYDGFDGARICGYYLLPKKRGPHPTILWLHGYGGNKLTINFHLKWVLLGYAILAIDIRGQNGESIDNKIYPGPSAIGYMTKGIFEKENYYYKGVYLDCVRAIDFLSKQKEIDINRICVNGASQGGGLSLAVGALDPRPKLLIAEMPYLCHFRRAVDWAEEVKNLTYLEFINIIKNYPDKTDNLFDTLSYFDNLNLCSWIRAKTLITCAMEDTVCPPSTIFAVYNHIKAKKYMHLMPYCNHSCDLNIMFGEKKLEYIFNNL